MSHNPLRTIPMALAALLALAIPYACGPDEEDREREPAAEESGAPTAGQAAATEEPAAATRPERGIAWVIFGSDTVRAEIAYRPADRERGLMYREELPDGRGMLFVFDESDTRAFWMQNTYIPLDIAYLDQDHRIVDIQQMEPETTDLYESAAPAMFALEVPQGWFEAHGISVGDRPTIIFGRF